MIKYNVKISLFCAVSFPGSSHNWSHITDQIGMFCFTGLKPDQVCKHTIIKKNKTKQEKKQNSHIKTLQFLMSLVNMAMCDAILTHGLN